MPFDPLSYQATNRSNLNQSVDERKGRVPIREPFSRNSVMVTN